MCSALTLQTTELLFPFTDEIAEAFNIMTLGRQECADCWLRPLGEAERLFAHGGNLGTHNTVLSLWLDSHQPIQKEQILKALKLWYR